MAGLVCGTFVDMAAAKDHGFFFDGTTYTQYDVPGAEHTDVNGLTTRATSPAFITTALPTPDLSTSVVLSLPLRRWVPM